MLQLRQIVIRLCKAERTEHSRREIAGNVHIGERSVLIADGQGSKPLGFEAEVSRQVRPLAVIVAAQGNSKTMAKAYFREERGIVSISGFVVQRPHKTI